MTAAAQRLEAEWRDFRRGLHPAQVPAWDRMWAYVREYAAALPHDATMDDALLLILQRQEVDLHDMRARLVRAAGAHAEDDALPPM